MIQKKILKKILYKIPVNSCCKGFVPHRSLTENARFHVGQEVLVKMDLKDYFPSIKEIQVIQFFFKVGYSKTLSVLLGKLCCLNGSLPQGAPTSPYLSNLITGHLDDRIFDLCQKNNHFRYTRYADDISLSGSKDLLKIVPNIFYEIKKSGLIANQKKFGVFTQNKRQKVTGIVVNQKMQVEKNYRKKIRQEIFFIKKFGIWSHLNRINSPVKEKNYFNYLLGKIQYVLMINPKDKEFISYRKLILGYVKKYSNSDF